MALFTLKNVRFQDILTYPDLEIAMNCTTFLCGASGSGKSMLLKFLSGVLSPTSGTITYAGKQIEGYDPIALRREVLLVGQSAYLFDESIQDNFRTYYAYRDLAVPTEATIKHYLDLCALNLPLDSVCTILSGGERQRVFLALNLSFGAKTILLDEPTSALDDKTARTLMDNIKLHCEKNNTTLIIVSHDKSMAEQYADQIIVIQK